MKEKEAEMSKLIDKDALASFQDKILRAYVIGDLDGDCVLVDWQPGNGTRYMTAFTRLHLIQAKAMGASADAVLVSLVWDGGKSRSWTFSGGFVHENYVAEKMGFQYGGDVLAFTALLNLALQPTEDSKRYAEECLDRACHRAA